MSQRIVLCLLTKQRLTEFPSTALLSIACFQREMNAETSNTLFSLKIVNLVIVLTTNTPKTNGSLIPILFKSYVWTDSQSILQEPLPLLTTRETTREK